MGSPEIKVVFDANVYVSFFIVASDTLKLLRSAWQEKCFLVYSSPDIIAEVQRVFRYPKLQKYLKTITHHHITVLFRTSTIMVHPTIHVRFDNDPDDAMYLEAAETSGADFLVTGDHDLLRLHRFHQTKILTPKDFMQHLQKQHIL